MSEAAANESIATLRKYKELIGTAVERDGEAQRSASPGNPGDARYDTHDILADFAVEEASRRRGSLVLLAHDMFGGTNPEAALHVGVIVERYQDVLLTLDDWMDAADIRRGATSVPSRFRTYAAKLGHLVAARLGHHAAEESDHKGNSLAINAAFMQAHREQYALMETPTDDSTRVRLSKIFNRKMFLTGEGQALDLTISYDDTVTEDIIRTMTIGKTAHYTFEGPLMMGACLADADDADLAELEKFGCHVGMAFQLKDDEDGIFGDESKTGKSARGDLRQGKETMLMNAALNRASPAQKAVLLAAKGNPDVTEQQHLEVQQIMYDTGALKYIESQAYQEASAAFDILAAHPEWGSRGVNALRYLVSGILFRY